jgi:GT2 family glycosyltransferase
MFSVICVYNNKKILEECLLKSLGSQTAKYELITIDNAGNDAFRSAVSALNHGAAKATAKYLMFLHQDIDLLSNKWLEETERILDSLPNLGIAGVAGRIVDNKFTISNIKHGIPPKLAGGIQIDSPTKVQTVDECLAIIPNSVFKKLQFDEAVCDDWHLYVTDYCLSVKKLGFDVFVIPMTLYHVSPGYSFSGKYYSTLKKVLEKHKKDYKLICAPYGKWSPFYPLVLQRILWVIRLGIRYLWRKSGLK